MFAGEGKGRVGMEEVGEGAWSRQWQVRSTAGIGGIEERQKLHGQQGGHNRQKRMFCSVAMHKQSMIDQSDPSDCSHDDHAGLTSLLCQRKAHQSILWYALFLQCRLLPCEYVCPTIAVFKQHPGFGTFLTQQGG
eukprot:410621-Rhodomonas_salina.1